MLGKLIVLPLVMVVVGIGLGVTRVAPLEAESAARCGRAFPSGISSDGSVTLSARIRPGKVGLARPAHASGGILAAAEWNGRA